MGEDPERREPDRARDRRGRYPGSVYDRIGSLTREARQARSRHRAQYRSDWGESSAAGLPGTPGRTVPEVMREAASWSWRMLVIGAVAYVLVRVLAMVPIVTVPFVVALLLTAVLGPVQRVLRDRLRVPHTLAAFLALLVGVGVLGLIGSFVGGQVSTNVPRLAEQLAATVDHLATWLRDGPLQISDAQVARYGDELQATVARNQERLVTSALSTLSALSHLLAGALLLLLATFFLLRDGDLIWRWAVSLLPPHSRARVDLVGRFGWRTLGGFMRGQTIIALLHATTVFVVLAVLHVPMALALSVLIFVASYIPILGMSVTGALCIIVSLIEHGPAAAVVVAITIIVLIQAEAHLLQPLIMARTVEVHPLGVAMAVLAGTTLGGIAGALFAVPAVAFLNATIRAAHMPMRLDDAAHLVLVQPEDQDIGEVSSDPRQTEPAAESTGPQPHDDAAQPVEAQDAGQPTDRRMHPDQPRHTATAGRSPRVT